MIVRAIDAEGDWLFGKGQNDYKRNNDAVAQNIYTRLNSFLGDCFFDNGAGIDWFNLLGAKNQITLNLAISAVITNTQYVTGINQLNVILNPLTRNLEISYQVQTSYSSASDTFSFDPNNV